MSTIRSKEAQMIYIDRRRADKEQTMHRAQERRDKGAALRAFGGAL